MNDGLKLKYDVYKLEDGTKVNNCFVLRPDKDPAAVVALLAYAATTPNHTLSADIIQWVGSSDGISVATEKPRVKCSEYEYELRVYQGTIVPELRSQLATFKQIAMASIERLKRIDALCAAFKSAGSSGVADIFARDVMAISCSQEVMGDFQ